MLEKVTGYAAITDERDDVYNCSDGSIVKANFWPLNATMSPFRR